MTLTLDRVILHIVVHHSTYKTNFTEIEETFCGRSTYLRTFETHFIRSTLESIGIVGFNVPLDTLQVISETILQVR